MDCPAAIHTSPTATSLNRIVSSSPDGNVYVGHLEPGCEVQYLAELSFVEVLDMDLTRRTDEFGIGYIDRL